MSYQYLEITKNDLPVWVALCRALWPHAKSEELTVNFEKMVSSQSETGFVCWTAENKPEGFVHVSIRNDYVEGTTTTPVGYIEGVYVDPTHRNKGIAKELLSCAEMWVRERGCAQMGSDTELENIESREFHKKLGFKETGTIVHFIKDISSSNF